VGDLDLKLLFISFNHRSTLSVHFFIGSSTFSSTSLFFLLSFVCVFPTRTMSRSRVLPPIRGLSESTKGSQLGGTGLLSSTGIISLQRLPATDKKKDICVRSLSEGFVQSFVDLFHFSYRDPILVDEASERYFSVPEELLFTLRDSLITAERSSREGKTFHLIHTRWHMHPPVLAI
jgi:hypothetical protein